MRMLTQRLGWLVIAIALCLVLDASRSKTVAAAPSPVPSSGGQVFQRIEQPWSIKVGVTVVGLGLIGAELWWFLSGHTSSKEASAPPDA